MKLLALLATALLFAASAEAQSGAAKAIRVDPQPFTTIDCVDPSTASFPNTQTCLEQLDRRKLEDATSGCPNGETICSDGSGGVDCCVAPSTGGITGITADTGGTASGPSVKISGGTNITCGQSGNTILCDGTTLGGITTLNSRGELSQDFSVSNDPNITLTITSTSGDHEFDIDWANTLADARIADPRADAYEGVTLKSADPSAYTFDDGDFDVSCTANPAGNCTITLATGAVGGDVSFTGAAPPINNFPAFADTTGKLIKDSGISLSHPTFGITGAGSTVVISAAERALIASHGAANHAGDVIPDANQIFGAYYSDYGEIADPPNPASNTVRMYAQGGTMCSRDDAGMESCMGGGTTPTGGAAYLDHLATPTGAVAMDVRYSTPASRWFQDEDGDGVLDPEEKPLGTRVMLADLNADGDYWDDITNYVASTQRCTAQASDNYLAACTQDSDCNIGTCDPTGGHLDLPCNQPLPISQMLLIDQPGITVDGCGSGPDISSSYIIADSNFDTQARGDALIKITAPWVTLRNLRAWTQHDASDYGPIVWAKLAHYLTIDKVYLDGRNAPRPTVGVLLESTLQSSLNHLNIVNVGEGVVLSKCCEVTPQTELQWVAGAAGLGYVQRTTGDWTTTEGRHGSFEVGDPIYAQGMGTNVACSGAGPCNLTISALADSGSGRIDQMLFEEVIPGSATLTDWQRFYANHTSSNTAVLDKVRVQNAQVAGITIDEFNNANLPDWKGSRAACVNLDINNPTLEGNTGVPSIWHKAITDVDRNGCHVRVNGGYFENEDAQHILMEDGSLFVQGSIFTCVGTTNDCDAVTIGSANHLDHTLEANKFGNTGTKYDLKHLGGGTVHVASNDQTDADGDTDGFTVDPSSTGKIVRLDQVRFEGERYELTQQTTPVTADWPGTAGDFKFYAKSNGLLCTVGSAGVEVCGIWLQSGASDIAYRPDSNTATLRMGVNSVAALDSLTLFTTDDPDGTNDGLVTLSGLEGGLLRKFLGFDGDDGGGLTTATLGGSSIDNVALDAVADISITSGGTLSVTAPTSIELDDAPIVRLENDGTIDLYVNDTSNAAETLNIDVRHDTGGIGSRIRVFGNAAAAGSTHTLFEFDGDADDNALGNDSTLHIGRPALGAVDATTSVDIITVAGQSSIGLESPTLVIDAATSIAATTPALTLANDAGAFDLYLDNLLHTGTALHVFVDQQGGTGPDKPGSRIRIDGNAAESGSVHTLLEFDGDSDDSDDGNDSSLHIGRPRSGTPGPTNSVDITTLAAQSLLSLESPVIRYDRTGALEFNLRDLTSGADEDLQIDVVDDVNGADQITLWGGVMVSGQAVAIFDYDADADGDGYGGENDARLSIGAPHTGEVASTTPINPPLGLMGILPVGKVSPLSSRCSASPGLHSPQSSGKASS